MIPAPALRPVLIRQLLLVCAATVFLAAPTLSSATLAGVPAGAHASSYRYDSPSAATTVSDNTRTDAARGHETMRGRSRSSTPSAALSRAAEGGLARFIAASDGTVIDRQAIGDVLSAQRQARHVLGSDLYAGGGYFTDAADAQRVLDAFHSGEATVLGPARSGVYVRYSDVTGFNNNPGAGFLNQPTDVFLIKGTRSVSVVPVSPTAGP